MKVMVIPNIIGVLSTVTKGSRGFGNNRTSENHLNYKIAEIGPSAEESPGDYWRLL